MKFVEIVSTHSKGNLPQLENDAVFDETRGIFVLADGFGGEDYGKVAAKTATQATMEFLKSQAGDRDATLPFEMRPYFSLAGNILFNSISFANKKVLDANGERGALERGGSSIVAGFLDGPILALANVGSTSVYLMRQGQCVSLVTPKSWGYLNQNWESPMPDFPMMALGMAEKLEPEISEVLVRKGDVFCLSSKYLALDRFSSFEGKKLDSLAEELIQGEKLDNLSIIFGKIN